MNLAGIVERRAGRVVRGRAAALALMTDTFTAYSPGGTTKDADDYEVGSFTNEGETPGKVSGRSREGDPSARTITVGGVDRLVIEGGLHIPLTAPVPVAHPVTGWEYECTQVGPTTDPALLGHRYRVVNAPMKSDATARRLDVVDVTDLS